MGDGTLSEVFRLCLEGEDESEFVNYFSDKQSDLADLNLMIRRAFVSRVYSMPVIITALVRSYRNS